MGARIPESKSANCSECGKVVWRSSTSAKVQTCLDCRRSRVRPRPEPQFETRVCAGPGCGVEFSAPMVGKRKIYCTRKCRNRRLVQCVVCDRDVIRFKESANPVCGSRCLSSFRSGRPLSPLRELVGPVVVEKSTDAPVTVVESSKRGFAAGECCWCGVPFVWDFSVGGVASTVCSSRCGRQRAKDRDGRFSVPTKVRLSVYERDGWTCQLCGDPVDAGLDHEDIWSATLDHIQPRSVGGSDDPDNLQLAHRWCNSVINTREHFGSDYLMKEIAA